MVRVGILGGRGYGGMELLRWLLGHPEVEVTTVTSRSQEGPVAAVHPHLAGFTDLAFQREDADSLERLAAEHDVLFQAKPHGVSAAQTPRLLAHTSVRVVDLSGDFRLRDAAAYDRWYGYRHPHPEALADAVWALPETTDRSRIAEARLVANPGCHATAAVLAVWPLARAGLLTGRVGMTSVTGSSGSGADPKPATHHPARFTNFKAYRPLEHQHLPEIVQALGGNVAVDLVPCSAPLARGIYVTAFAPVGDAAAEAVRDAYAAAYADEPFVRLRDAPPDLRTVVGTNLADVSVTTTDGLALVTVAIDNLGKGMAGTAVQNMNRMLGLDETTGLLRPGAGL